MPKGRSKTPKQENELLDALKFLARTQDKKQTLCRLIPYGATVFDGTIAAGTPVKPDLNAVPDMNALMLALAHCGTQYAVVQTSATALTVRSGAFQAEIPCQSPETLPSSNPDAMVMPLNADFLPALAVVSKFLADKTIKVFGRAALLRNECIVAVDDGEHLIIERWHGNNMPTTLLPIECIKALLKYGQPPIGFGASPDTLTFWFVGNRWIKTQLYKDAIVQQYPNVDKFIAFDMQEPVEFDATTWEAIKMAALFADATNDIILRAAKVECGKSFNHLNLNIPPRKYKLPWLTMLADLATALEPSREQFTLFRGDKLRGAIWHQALDVEEEIEEFVAGVPL